MKKFYWSDIKKIFINYIIFIIPISIILIVFLNNFFNKEIENSKELIIEEQYGKSKMISYIIEDVFQGIFEDLFVLKNSNELSFFINNGDNNDLEESQKMFLRFVKNKKNFEQLRYIDSFGKEVIRVNNYESGPVLANTYELQDKSSRDYYLDTKEIGNGNGYVSNMDFNIENNKIVYPYDPVIRIATPLYSSKNIFKGILIINYSGEDFLKIFNDEFLDTKFNFVKPTLVDNNGYYIYSDDDEKNFGFMFSEKNDFTIAKENPELWNLMKSKEYGVCETDKKNSIFMKVNILERISENIETNKQNWYIISEFNLADLPIVKRKNFLGIKDSDFIMLIGIWILSFIMVAINHYSKKDREELNITKKISENTNDAVVITDNKTNILYVNKAFEKYTGYTMEDVIGLKTNHFKSNKHSLDFYKEMWASINNFGFWHGELWDKKKDGVLYPKKLSIFAIKNGSDTIAKKYVGIFKDLTQDKKNQEYVDKLKNYNFQTNLPNENLLSSLIEKSIFGSDKNFYIFYFSIENFNSIILNINENESTFINVLIDRIKNIIENDDFIAQITKNNFVLGISTIDSRNDIDKFLEKFFEEMKKPTYIKNSELFFDIKAGISIYPDDSRSSEELIFDAYLALEKVLELKETNFLFYDSSFKNVIKREMEMNLLLRKAISNNEFNVYYQPQVDMRNETVIGAEALIRWNSDLLGNVSPVVFIPLAEKTRQILEIGYWIIEEVCKDYFEFIKTFNSDFRISINISPLQFKDKNLISILKSFMNTYEINPKNFEIEITEGVLMTDGDVNYVNHQLDQFRNLGLTVSIDDFGTGFSSLSYLKKLNVDKLKIDRSFIKDYPDKDNGEIAELITNIGNKLNLKIIAEGAETLNQINYLKSIGCNLVQGYYYSRPLNKDNFIKYVKKMQTSSN